MAECSESIGRSQASGVASGSRASTAARAAGLGPGLGHDEVPARDERLLVGRRDDLAGPQRRERRPQRHDAAGPDDHEVHVIPGGELDEGVLAPDAGHAGGQIELGGIVREGDGRGVEAPGLGLELRRVAAGGQGRDLEPVGVGLEDLHRLPANAPGGAQQRDADAPAVSEPARRHTARRLGPRTGTSRSGRASRRGPGSGPRSPSPRRPA